MRITAIRKLPILTSTKENLEKTSLAKHTQQAASIDQHDYFPCYLVLKCYMVVGNIRIDTRQAIPFSTLTDVQIFSYRTDLAIPHEFSF